MKPLLAINRGKTTLNTYERLRELGYDCILVEGADAPAVQSVPTKDDRRFTAAVAAMQGMLATEDTDIGFEPYRAAERAVGFADALLAELSKDG